MLEIAVGTDGIQIKYRREHNEVREGKEIRGVLERTNRGGSELSWVCIWYCGCSITCKLIFLR